MASTGSSTACSRARSTASSGRCPRSVTTARGPAPWGRTCRSRCCSSAAWAAIRRWVPSASTTDAIGRLATEHLLLGGARHVGIITGPLNWWEAQQRELGWRETLLANGLPAHELLVAIGDWGATSGEEGLYRLLEQEPELDAVFASNDQMALGVLHAAHRLGRRIPDDLSVVGVDNIAEASHFWPSLTTVDQPLRDAGALAVREIDGAIRRARLPRRGQESPAGQMTLLSRSSSSATAVVHQCPTEAVDST